MGGDKLWTDFWGRPTWRWALDVLLASPGLIRVAIVVPADAVERFGSALPAAHERCMIVAGGEARADSVIAGLWALTGAGHDDATLVLVHDAARPAVSVELVEAIAAAAGLGVERAVVPVVPIVDSLKRVRGERVVAPVERDEVAAAQTPQAARLGALRAAIEESHAWGRPVTDDAGALAAAGVPVHTIPGDPANRKLTEPGDVAPMRAVLAERRGARSGRATCRPAAGSGSASTPTAWPRAGRCASEGSRGTTSPAARSATPTAMRRSTRSSTRCSAPHGWVTSARSFRRARRTGRAPTRRSCW